MLLLRLLLLHLYVIWFSLTIWLLLLLHLLPRGMSVFVWRRVPAPVPGIMLLRLLLLLLFDQLLFWLRLLLWGLRALLLRLGRDVPNG